MKPNPITLSQALARQLLPAVVAAVVAIGGATLAQAQEHPEHPTGTTKAESAVTLEDVAQHIESYVKQGSKDSALKIEDKQAGKQLSLTLDRVHRERLSQVGPDIFFVCADFKSADGKTYDLDFFVQGTSKENLRVLPDKTSIHKENGKERYSWVLDAKTKLWMQKPVVTPAKEPAAIEHP